MTTLRAPRLLSRSLSSKSTSISPAFLPSHGSRTTRYFHATAMRQTDGVFPALTEMRVRTPWIVALRESQKSGQRNLGVPREGEPTALDLTPKRMADSYVRIVIPLAQDPWMLDTYSNYAGKIRIGTLLMDLDALSGVVAYKHTGEGVSTVTAAVDRISIRNPLDEICDLELSGQVTYATGRSSMEISCQIAKVPQDGGHVKPEDVFMTCTFTMVGLDPKTKKPISLPTLKLETESDRALFKRGEENYKAKKARKSSSIMQTPPNTEESELIHKMWSESLAYNDNTNPANQPANVVSMSKTTIHSTSIMQPQYRNRHNFMIFGGFLLKTTFELAFTCAASFSHSRPQFINLDPSVFEQPVPVGSVLYVSAGVTYTEPDSRGGTRIQVMVRTHVREVEHREHERKTTGTFYYTFYAPAEVSVLPESYSEYMKWVGGRRRAHILTDTLALEEKMAENTILGHTATE